MNKFTEKDGHPMPLYYLSKTVVRANTRLTSAFVWSCLLSLLAYIFVPFRDYISANACIYVIITAIYIWIICGIITFLLIIFGLYFQLRCLLSVSNKLEVLKSWLLCNNQTRYVPYRIILVKITIG